MISRSNISKQITNGTANKKRDTMSRFRSTGDDAKDLEMIMSGQKIKRPLNASEIKTKTDNPSNKKQKNIQKFRYVTKIKKRPYKK